MIIDEIVIDFYYKENAWLQYGWTEQMAYDYYTEKGYEVIRGNTLPLGIIGCPDFFVKNGNDSFWVEVKRVQEHFRPSQLKWIENNKDEKVVVFKVLIKFPEVSVSDLKIKMGLRK